MKIKNPIVIAGPTGCGKSHIALMIAKKLDGEIVCADSRQLYENLCIATAAPTKLELRQVKHYGYNVVPLYEKFNAVKFVKLCDSNILDIKNKGKLPILVGGSGLYLRFFRYGFSNIPGVNQKIREKLKIILKEKGVNFLYKYLCEIDIDIASKIYSNDSVRIIRALEIYKLTNKKPSIFVQNNNNQNIRINAFWFLCWPDRFILENKLLNRIEQMFDYGLIKEAIKLRKSLPENHYLLYTIGYKEALLFYDKKITLQEAKERIFFRHRKYAKRQYTWFKKEKWWKKIDPFSVNIVNDIIKMIL